MTRRAVRICGLGRRFGDRRRRGDHGRRLGDANRLRRGGAGRGGAEPAAWRAPAAWPPAAAVGVAAGAASIRLGRMRPVGRAGAGAVSAAGRGGGSASRAAPFACGFLRLFGPGGGRFARRTSLPTDFDDEGTGRTLHGDDDLCGLAAWRGRPTRIAAGRPAASPHADDRGAKNASRVNGGSASANRNLTLSGSFAND